MYSTYDIFDGLRELRSVVDTFFKDTPSLSRRFEFPYVNLHEDNNALTVRALAPGVKVEEMNIHLVDNGLIIEGEKKADYEQKPYIRKERSFGKFQKSIKLPFRVDVNNIQASMRDGILTVKLFKSEDAKPRRIEIK
jgi:HSP20 family protein